MYDTRKKYTGKIVDRIKSTWTGDLPPASVDGLGTKGVYHWEQRTFREAALDALAANFNDMAMVRGSIDYLLDHVVVPQDDEEACLGIIDVLVDECRKRRISLLGGETSIHDNYPGLEISVSVFGHYLMRRRNVFRENDYLIGLKSSGLHCNGFTRVREIFGEEFRPEFVEPTFIYYDAILEIIQEMNINGMMNITGGAFTKLESVLGGNDIEINGDLMKPQRIFHELYERGVSDEEMHETFNCGIGFILSVPEDPERAIDFLSSKSIDSGPIGKVVRGNGRIKIQSAFSGRELVL